MSEIWAAEIDSSHCNARDTQSINNDYTDSIFHQVTCFFSKGGVCQLITNPTTSIKRLFYMYLPRYSDLLWCVV